VHCQGPPRQTQTPIRSCAIPRTLRAQSITKHANILQTIEAATQAIEGGRDLIVDDRKIRTEHAEARREYILQNADTGLSIGSGSVVLSRVGGGPVSKDEAHELLSRYGPIQETQPTTHADANTHGIPEGIWVKFAYYLDFKDALKVSCHPRICCPHSQNVRHSTAPPLCTRSWSHQTLNPELESDLLSLAAQWVKVFGLRDLLQIRNPSLLATFPTM